MADLQTDMARAVNDFVAQVTEIAKRAALDTLGTALGSASSVKRGSNGAFSRHAGISLGRGVKRGADQLEKTAASFHNYVAANPGLRIEQINKQIGLTTAELALPIRKLIASGQIKTKGQKRSTTYFAGSKK